MSVPLFEWSPSSPCSNSDIKALVTTGEGKYYSNGLDTDNYPSYTEEDIHQLFDVDLHNLFKRMLTFPIATVAAINGKPSSQILDVLYTPPSS